MKLAAYKEMLNNEIKVAVRKGYKITRKIRPINQVGKLSHSQYGTDHTKEYTEYLDTLGVKYTIGNDSPRGGQLGKFIEIKIDGRNTYIKSLKEEIK